MGHHLDKGERLVSQLYDGRRFYHFSNLWPEHVIEGEICWCEPLEVVGAEERMTEEICSVVDNYFRGH